MLSVTDAKKVIDDLQKYPFICSDTKIVTESKYVIMTQKEYEKLIEISGNIHDNPELLKSRS